MKVAVVGANGQLGADVVRALGAAGGYEVFELGHAHVEVADPESARAMARQWQPDVVVNCAAFHRVDECEDRIEEAFRVNALGALHVARACAEIGARCVYISTDFVFDGQKGAPYIEEDRPHPINVYGVSKLAGEHLVRQSCARWLIVRVASLFGKTAGRGKGSNFVEAILAKAAAGAPIRVIDDIRMSPTYTWDAARALEYLIRQEVTGVCHLTNAGACTWYEYAQRILTLAGLPAEVEAIKSRDFPAKARRPRDSSLRSGAAGDVVRNVLRPWDQALQAYLRERNVSARGAAPP